jgi:hypothetical protein
MPKKCVNGNCSRRKECGTYHQAVNTLEASGSNGKFERHSCRKGKCDHFTVKEYVPYGEEWEHNTMALPKSVIVGMLKACGQERDKYRDKAASLQTAFNVMGEIFK